MASDQTAVSRGKMASVKSDYIIEPEKIASSLRFFRDVGNKVMKNVEIDQDAINNLPSDKTSVDMLFTTEQETEDSHQDPDLVQSVEFDNGTGGPSLSRSNEEFLDGVFESATVTIGAVEPEEINDHGKIARVLHTILDEGTSPNEVTSKDDLGTNKSSSTYVVRPEKEFMSDSNPDYLELHYPDLFPFGCGGFGEQRKNPISRKALVQHLLNLSSRQFQQVDFVLPIYDMVTRQQVSNMAYVRSILPSRLSGSERGTTNSKGEVYGRVSMEDLRAAHGYKVTCAEAASQGCRFPLPPASLNGLAIDFFTDIGISTQPMQHSQAAANRNRQKVYAAHNSLGKAQIWFTVSPDDTQSFKIVVNALGSQAVNFENPVPTGEKRFKLLAKHPVAAALHFQRILKMVIKKVLGWNRSQLLPYRSGGVFGVPKGYLYLVEEQSRLTLHAHFLIWLYGHENIERQLLRASRLDEEERKANDVSHNVHELFQRTVGEDHLTHLAKVLQLLAKNIESFSTGELRLPETEMALITKCPVYNCPGELELASSAAQDMLRSRPKNIDIEPHGLKCPICQVTYTVTSRIDAALQSGYRRCFGKEQLTKKEVIDLIWLGMPLQPNAEDVNAFDRWLLHFASIQVLVNMHDWKHRSSCFKNGRLFCRYNTPHDTVQETNVTPVYAKSTNLTEDEDPTLSSASKEIVYLNISLKKRAVFMFMTDCNPSVMAVLGCNNCTRYVENQKISLYYGAYASKYSSENGKALAELMRSLNAYEERRLLKEQQVADEIEKEADLHVVSDNNPARSDASIGFGRLMSGARAATNGETVGAPVAAFCALGNDLFEMSHETAILPLTQARAFVQGEQLTASINKHGTVFATIHDYVYRSSNDPSIIDGMNYWQFVGSQETCKLKSFFQDVEESDIEDTECVQRGRLQHRFQQDHPRFETHGHWERTHLHWPQYTAQRLPDVLDLRDDSEVSADERTSKRERYAEDVLIMFFPFRKLIDIFDVDSTWWSSYLKRKPLLDSNDSTVETLSNIQNYYESFCRKNCLSEDHPFCQGDPITAVPKDDNNDDIVNLMEVDGDHLNTASAQDATANNATDPFVKLLATFTDNPVRLKLVSGYVSVTQEQARLAINVLPKPNNSKKTTFTLPGRSQVGPLVEDPSADAINGKVRLDAPVGTRTELLEHIEEALSNRTAQSSPITSRQPEKLEPNFPTLQKHSEHWGLNEKQHLAFVLIGAALLQHVALANSSSTDNPSTRMALLTSNIQALDII
ncbi:hypothetical protein DAPPUDRAFT_325613 [Daphnia pulex]|uniref:Helitron helicase-like domain-containing protein n=1 Tax=Daphnia pulex TaxID=6669 RepID=E9H597_DAPPU|nr:hypothetical protein DAPPUDRAFT_325613 [Daphnia pulex]|eukprot:EFX73115.1 hypothetical protein DAPPUDRAFT_325613 [Daphnia pulex]